MKQRLGIQARLRRLDPRLVDGLLGLLIAVVSLPAFMPTVEGSRREPDGWSLALILLMSLPITYRRREIVKSCGTELDHAASFSS